MKTGNIRICQVLHSLCIFPCPSSVGIVDSLVQSITLDWVGCPVFQWNGMRLMLLGARQCCCSTPWPIRWVWNFRGKKGGPFLSVVCLWYNLCMPPVLLTTPRALAPSKQGVFCLWRLCFWFSPHHRPFPLIEQSMNCMTIAVVPNFLSPEPKKSPDFCF